MKRIPAASAQATQAQALVSDLQQRFVQGLEALPSSPQGKQRFTAVEWFRDSGKHGGGIRFETADGPLFGRGSVNVSQVHYDDMPDKKLGSATAISTIIHPCHPLAPSVHIHISWTEMKQGGGYWRMMADLNPSIPDDRDTMQFFTAIRSAAPAQFAAAKEQGERYFFIPALKRHRGVAHFYLESYHTADAAADFKLAQTVGEAAIDTYLDILNHSLSRAHAISDHDRAAQLAYHTMYFFQVLTLDRGTTTGLLVHDQNDVGIMGSLPACVDRDLLSSWVARMQAPQDDLLTALIDALPAGNPCLVDEAVKSKLAAVVRAHYRRYPQAIGMQASGDVIPGTVQNHTD